MLVEHLLETEGAYFFIPHGAILKLQSGSFNSDGRRKAANYICLN